MKHFLAAFFVAILPPGLMAERSAHEQLAFDIFKELVETDTTHSTGNTLKAAEQLAARFHDEGFDPEDVNIVLSGESYGTKKGGTKKGNLVVRLRSERPELPPILLLAHLDVVEADPADWSMDPKVLNEVDGYYYGRGTLDDKDEVAIHAANLIWLKRALDRNEVDLRRDIIGAFTADEEGGPENGAQFLVANHRNLVDAAFVINEGGGGVIIDGKHVSNSVQTAEKVYQSYTLEVTNPGGHSSLPRADNAIYELADALKRVQAHEFPAMLNDTTRAFFQESAKNAGPVRARHLAGLLETLPAPESVEHFRDTPAINARLRTTCVATQLKAGHAENALPQRARATVNCRVFPGMPVEEVRQALIKAVANGNVSITPVSEALTSDASPLTNEVMDPIRQVTESMWPGVNVVPIMSTGATDGLFFRNGGIPVYGVSGIFVDANDNRAHGRDERIRVQSFYEGLAFLYKLTRAYAAREGNPS